MYAPVSVHGASGPPSLTVHALVAGATVDLDEAGAQVTVALSTTSDYFPLIASIAFDSTTTSEPFSSAQYQKTITLAPMPLGTRTIEVAVADRDGLTSTQTSS